MTGNERFSFILECTSASPEVIQVSPTIVHDHDGDVRDHGGDVRDHDGDVDDHDGAIDDGVYHSNSVARYTGRYSEDSNSDPMGAQ